MRLGGSGPGSVALIRSATGQHCITPSMTKRKKKKETWEMASESQLVGTAHSPQPEHNSAGLEA